MQYALIDADGNLTGLLDDKVEPVIPAGAVPLTADQYAQWLCAQARMRWVGGALVEAPAAPAPASP